ncbi:MAG TPA: bifunctional DNA-formamidopyrimidine glycosylase/DNA-(apurinic or apyrimidinic site) lyase [Rubrivivax sp.]|nr:bifunctional DNA-formamidopyrimidine glycosylase/DNA-(apurinic or apyrimidinic site) lyase [Rubrivivax sp.]
MPELPEVEVTRRGIAKPLQGAQVLQLRLGKPLRWPLGCEPEGLAGSRVGEITRRGKYLWLPLTAPLAVHRTSTGTAYSTAGEETPVSGGLLLHLGMSGSLSLSTSVRPPGPHDHFDLVTDRGTLRLNDPRRFGAVVWSQSLLHDPAASLLRRLGPEPFDQTLTAQTFHAALQGRRTPIKALLLSGDVVVGAGNIYACEALFRAGIHPALRADRISRPRAARLLAELRSTLSRAVELGGSTLRDFTDALGASGAYQSQAGVYGRVGLPCGVCGGTVKRVVHAQRSTFFCSTCQRR